MRSSGSVEGRPVGRAQAPDADQRDCDKDIDPPQQMALPTVCGPIIARLRRSQPYGPRNHAWRRRSTGFFNTDDPTRTLPKATGRTLCRQPRGALDLAVRQAHNYMRSSIARDRHPCQWREHLPPRGRRAWTCNLQ
jgi:hypothetical protein